MDFGNIPLFQMMQQKLQYHGARQALLAKNVANLDTPGYRAQDMKSPDFEAMLSRQASAGSVATTNHMHIRPGMENGAAGKVILRGNTYELNPIGNNVVVEEEMMRVAENQSEYQKVLGIYRKSLEMFRIALGKAGGA